MLISAVSQTCAPILLLGFNRPDLLRGLVEILAKVQPPKLYLAVDGPRSDHPGEAERCAECAAMLDNLGWPCKVETLARTENLGCRLAVTGAIDWFFSKEEEGIILEDDCWPEPSFLRFATELLERYRNDPRVGMISGQNAYGFITNKKDSYRFSTKMSIWGWATWRRAWLLNEQDPDVICRDSAELVKRSNLTRRGQRFDSRFVKQYLAEFSTWDIPWMLSLERHEMLSIVPARNLSANVGFNGESGTHTTGFSFDQCLFAKTGSLSFPLIHPASVKRDNNADRLHELRTFALLPRMLTVVGLKFGTIGRVICLVAMFFERICPVLYRL